MFSQEKKVNNKVLQESRINSSGMGKVFMYGACNVAQTDFERLERQSVIQISEIVKELI